MSEREPLTTQLRGDARYRGSGEPLVVFGRLLQDRSQLPAGAGPAAVR
jgi:hypothetical protein